MTTFYAKAVCCGVLKVATDHSVILHQSFDCLTKSIAIPSVFSQGNPKTSMGTPMVDNVA